MKAGLLGFGIGLFKSARELTFKNRPRKLIVTSMINMVGKHSSKCANAGASVTLLYCILKKVINFIFEEELQTLTPIQKQALYGFMTGVIYKSTRGVMPMILCGTLFSSICVVGTDMIERMTTSKKIKKV